MAKAEEHCWNCQASVLSAAMVCDACGVLQPPRALDCFTRLGLPVTIALDDATLQEAYRLQLAQCHPDLFRTKTWQEQDYAARHAAEVSLAYRHLRDEHTRIAQALSILAPDKVSFEQTMAPNDAAALFALGEELCAVTPAAARARIAMEEEKCRSALHEAFRNHDYDAAARGLALARAVHRLLNTIDDTNAGMLYAAANC